MITKEKELEITVEEFIKLVPNCCPHCVEELFPDLVMLPLIYEDAKVEDIAEKFKRESSITKHSQFMISVEGDVQADGSLNYDKSQLDYLIENLETSAQYGDLATHQWLCNNCGSEIEFNPENY